MERLFYYLLFLSFTLCVNTVAFSADSLPRKGLVLVHGTNDHSKNASGSYWKTAFVEELAQALPDKDRLFVAHCDFGQYMWDSGAADCLAYQLEEFIDAQKLDKLVLYAHSDGANVVRWILSNPTYDPRYYKIWNTVEEVIAVAPSSGGTPLADEAMAGGLFEEGLSWLLGYQNNAVRQQRVGDMRLFNQAILLGAKGQPALAMPFRVVVGTDVHASPLSSASYCNGLLLNSALKISKIYLDKCADGFLNCQSQAEAGDIWFYDINKMDNANTLSHNQSRHNCFGLDTVVLEHLAYLGVIQ